MATILSRKPGGSGGGGGAPSGPAGGVLSGTYPNPGFATALALTKIGEIDLTSTQAFTSIPGTYSDLRLVVFGRGTQSAATVVPNARFNSDSGANYESNLLGCSNNTTTGTATAGETSVLINVYPGATAVANRAGYAIIDICEYANTNFHKICNVLSGTIYDTAATNYVIQYRASQWRNTAAITRIDIGLSAGAWAAGSTARLYGIM